MSATPYPTQQTMAIQQPQTVIVQNPEKEYPSFASRKAVSIGGIQLSLGVMAIIFQISATAIDAENGSAAGGIWAGFFVSFIHIICIVSMDFFRKSDHSDNVIVNFKVTYYILCVYITYG